MRKNCNQRLEESNTFHKKNMHDLHAEKPVMGRWMNLSYTEYVSLSVTIIARNSPVSFPDQPLIALALVIGPLIELPVLAIVSQLLLLTRKKAQDT